MTVPFHILVVDDNAGFRNGFRRLLEKMPGVGDITEAEDGETAMLQASQCNPDLIFMDITMPKLDGFEATRRIHQKHPAMKIAMLTVHSNQGFLDKSMDAGACGFLTKNTIHEDLAEAVTNMMQGTTYISKSIAIRNSN